MSTRTARKAAANTGNTVKVGGKSATTKTTAKPKPAAKPAASKQTQKTVTLTFDLEKETPGTHRYAERGEKDAKLVGTLYIRKDKASALFGKAPKTLKVVVEVA